VGGVVSLHRLINANLTDETSLRLTAGLIKLIGERGGFSTR
jgi:hypothetical protein